VCCSRLFTRGYTTVGKMATSTGGVMYSPCPLNFKDTSPIHHIPLNAMRVKMTPAGQLSLRTQSLSSHALSFSSAHGVLQKDTTESVKSMNEWRLRERDTHTQRERESSPRSEFIPLEPPSVPRALSLSLSLCLHAYGIHDML